MQHKMSRAGTAYSSLIERPLFREFLFFIFNKKGVKWVPPNSFGGGAAGLREAGMMDAEVGMVVFGMVVWFWRGHGCNSEKYL